MSPPAPPARPAPDRGRLEESPAHGVSEGEAARRLAERPRRRRPPTSRSYSSIVRANVFTVFNAILAVFGTITLVFGDWRDALFLGVLVANTTIGIGQEVRAKRTLDRLAALVAPHATVVRDGVARRVGVEELVVGDHVEATSGDQVVADGTLVRADGVRLDEAILTGESEPVAREEGEPVRSGSFVVEGAAAYVVEAVGEESYAERLAGEARRFRHPRSPLERAFNRLLLVLVAVMVPLAAVLGVSLWRRDPSVGEAVTTATAGAVSLVPEGLILLMSLTFAVAAVRLARRGAYAQQLNAVESLAAVDVVCIDKTGTLTDGTLRVVEVVAADGVGDDEAQAVLGRLVASTPGRNATLAAIAEALPGDAEDPDAVVAFSSRRKWSAIALGDEALVIGAPERLPLGPLAQRAAAEAAAGRRVLAFGRAKRLPEAVDGPPEGVAAAGLVVLSERLREETRETVAFLRAEGVEIKVLSGDAPATVGAIAADAGIEVRRPMDGGDLPLDDDAALDEVARRTTLVGRITPEGKRAFVATLTAQGRYVAMIGDGVNDVPALKQARLAIAQGSGSQMAKSVADVVLVSGDFAALPRMVDEGRNILRNLQRVAKLYVSKSVFAGLLILSVGTTAPDYPLLPRHLSLVSTLTIGVPTFFLALVHSAGPWRSRDFLREVAAFAVPAGAAACAGLAASYLVARHALDMDLVEARTVATTVLASVGLVLVVALERSSASPAPWLWPLVGALAVAYVLALVLPFTREFFALAAPDVEIVALSAAGVALALGALRLVGFPPRPEIGGAPARA